MITDVGSKILQVWDAPEGKPLRTIELGMKVVGDFKLSPDGKRIGVVGYSFDRTRRLMVCQIAFLDLTTGRHIVKGEWNLKAAVSSLVSAPDGKSVATLSDEGMLRLWDSTKAGLISTVRIGERAATGWPSRRRVGWWPPAHPPTPEPSMKSVF